jgi:hypothetical protein
MGIKTKELDVPTGQILGNPMLHSDFHGLVMLYKDFINQSKSSSSSGSSAPMQNVQWQVLRKEIQSMINITVQLNMQS